MTGVDRAFDQSDQADYAVSLMVCSQRDVQNIGGYAGTGEQEDEIRREHRSGPAA